MFNIFKRLWCRHIYKDIETTFLQNIDKDGIEYKKYGILKECIHCETRVLSSTLEQIENDTV